MKTNRRNFIKTLGSIALVTSISHPLTGKENYNKVPSIYNGNTGRQLKFNSDGKFKIVQFTDTHYIYNDPRAEIAKERIKEVLIAEKPDLVVLTGDIIYGKPAKESLETILNLISDQKIPFALTWGNHDAEQKVSRENLLKIAQNNPYNLTFTEKGISGVSNYTLPIQTSAGNKNDRILYFFDSHDYSKIKGINGYDLIKRDQIEWYCQKSTEYTLSNNGSPIPSLAFFHIPLPEYKQAASDEKSILFGTRKERVCSPNLNSGLFTAMKTQGDIEGIFVGHDHNNDYAVMWYDILLAYGRYSGGNTVYNDLPNGNGARIIELTEGKNGFRTWIRLKDNTIENDIIFPDSFLKK